MAGKIVADTIESAGSQISLNVGNVTVLTASSTGLTLTPTTNVNINVTNSTLAFGAGNVSFPSITASGDTNTGLYFPAADTIGFVEGGAEAMRIDSSGNVGIGVAPTTVRLQIKGNGSDPQLYLTQYNVSDDGWKFWANAAGGPLSFIRRESSTDTERMSLASNGNLSFNSGYGSVATAYGCRAWVAFNGTGTVAIRGSGNVSSITDFGVGDYAINFTIALVDTNYCIIGGSIKGAGGPSNANSGLVTTGETPATGSVGVGVVQADGTAVDRNYVYAAVFR